MTPPNNLAFLHTSPSHVPTFEALVQRVAPGVRVAHHVREDLLDYARVYGPDDPALVQQVQEAMRSAATSGAQVVVCTCSSIGAAAETTVTGGQFLAQRVDRAMADHAARSGTRLWLVAALPSTVAPTRALIEDSAQRIGMPVALESLVVDSAWPHFLRDDQSAYIDAIVEAVRGVASVSDTVVLAQASMAAAAIRLADMGVQALSSPEPGVRRALDSLMF
ncbi:Asp/Glu/hydantoin racemase [Hydrogenophaga defluvii]|uniref:Asp/Glu/hydantoin racemase n=1 Tax=Hydrogenophaga defluvii TaxID=249410 RepID=A0ABW2SA31_9BURK